MPSGYSAVIYRPVITVVCAQQAVHRSETVIKCSAKMPKQEKKKKENENNDHTPPMHALCIHGTIKQV